MVTDSDLYWMQQALKLAEMAASKGEVPIGAVLVKDDVLIATAHNCPIASHDPTAHAEMMVLRTAAQQLQNYRLVNTKLYVTLEPCMMCVGALVHARIAQVIFGAYDAKAGAIVSKANLLDEKFLNHRVQYAGGIMAEACGKMLSDFFRKKRTR